MPSSMLIFGFLLASGLACAAGQDCPSTICQAKFDNAYPAPTDCCVHNYTSNPRCQWGGTPVSWSQVRTCSAGGANYSVLIKADSQGPPSSAECRCNNTIAANGGNQTTYQPLQLSASVTLKPSEGKDMAGNDIACNGQSFCKAKFDNAYPAPTDCCVHDYKSSARCQWGGTPVSWSQVRTCSAGGANYSVLIKADSQGPPSSAECRCGNTIAAGGGSQTTKKPLQLSASVTLKPLVGKDVGGNDITCNGQSFCKVCGGLESVRAACAQQLAQCKALTFNPLDNCGYLKRAAGALSNRTGWVAYVQSAPK